VKVSVSSSLRRRLKDIRIAEDIFPTKLRHVYLDKKERPTLLRMRIKCRGDPDPKLVYRKYKSGDGNVFV